jgi:hypothetical protein
VRTRHAHCGFLEKNILQFFFFPWCSLVLLTGFLTGFLVGFLSGSTQKTRWAVLGKRVGIQVRTLISSFFSMTVYEASLLRLLTITLTVSSKCMHTYAVRTREREQ